MKDRFMKNGVFSLEYDKETLRDMVLELQEENQKLKKTFNICIKMINDYLENNYSIFPENEIEIELIKYLKDILKVSCPGF